MRLTRARAQAVALACGYAVATSLVYLTFREYSDRSTTGAARWAMFYVSTVVYPAWWALSVRATLDRAGLSDRLELRRLAWAPVVVGGISFAAGLALVWDLQR